MTIDTIILRSKIDLTGADRGLDRLTANVDRFVRDAGRSLGSLRIPDLKLPTIEAPKTTKEAGPGGDVAGSLAQLASFRIPALDAVAGQVTRLAPLFERMAGAVILSFRRADSATKLPLTKIAIERTRAYIADRMDDLPPRAAKVAGAIDSALAGLQFGRKIAGQVHAVTSALTSLDSKIARESGRALGPMQQFGPVGVKSIRAVEGAANQAAGSFRGLGVQIAAAAGFTGLAYEATSFFRAAIKGASDYNETLSASKSILGGNAVAAERLSDDLARSFGLAKRSTLELQNSIGGLLKGTGLSGAGLDAKLGAITRRVADLASNQNKSADEVGQAFLIQLSGEQSDFMKRLGVDTTEQTLKQYALAAGIAKAGVEMNRQQKVLASLGIIMDKTSFAAGDLAATVDQPANAFRKFQGQIENFQVTLGAAFLPAASRALAILNDLATGGAGVFDGNSAGMRAFSDRLNEAVDTAGAFIKDWDLALQVATIHAGAMAHNFGESLRVAIETGLGALDEKIRRILGPLGKGALGPLGIALDANAGPGGVRAPNLIDAGKLAAPLLQRMGDNAVARAGGGAPLKPAPAAGKAPPAPVDQAKLDAMLAAAEKQKAFVKSFTDKLRTPFEEFMDIVKMGKQAFADGQINAEQLGRLNQYALKESGLDKQMNPETRFAGAVERGTQEYASAVNRAIYGAAQKPDDQLKQLNKGQLDELKEIKKGIDRLAGKREPEPPKGGF